ncbi:MAG: hypothetical protein ACLQDQ_07660 [Myxococcaceae bacterium]
MQDAARQTVSDEASLEALERLASLGELMDPTALLSKPEVTQAVRLAAAAVALSDLERYDGLQGVMVGRAYSIAYQELSRYQAKDGPLVGWLSRRVQDGLLRDFA